MNILLLQLKRIGDLVVTTPSIAAVREKFSDARVTLVIANECATLAPAISCLDRILIVRRGLHDLAALFGVAREKFDYCVDFTENDRSALLTFLSRARKRIASERIKQKSRARAWVYNEFVPLRITDMPTVDYNLALLRPLGIESASRKLHLDLPRAAQDEADRLQREAKIDNEFIIFHPGSARPEKLWPSARWAEVIRHARSRWKIAAVLTGATTELEQRQIGEIKSQLGAGSEFVVDLSGKTDLLALAALISRARLLVTVDSAPMHLAAAANAPQVALFGPTNPFHWRPQESPALILQGESPVPVTEFSASRPKLPMSQISTQAVIDAMELQLSKASIDRARVAPATTSRTEQAL